jgi:lysophospholipase L1-like esterase
MNINPTAKRILCYGDSLTYGSKHAACSATSSRFPINQRWTGILQSILGNDYEIIEEGLSGRTTDMDDKDSSDRNGLKYFRPCLTSHFPIDLLVLLLGTNDLKDRFHKTPTQIANSLISYIKFVKEISSQKRVALPQILLLTPPLIIQKYLPQDWDFKDGEEKSKQLSAEYQEVATETATNFFDLSTLVTPSPKHSGHLSEKDNQVIAEKLSEIIKSKLL